MLSVFRFLLFCVLLCPFGAEARSLFWQDIEVKATLDGGGRLHIQEQQTIVFSGDWNGGERIFRVFPGQKMKFESISRLDANGRNIPLQRGNLQLVDHWDHNGQTAIRWRSRLPSDPVFNNTSITYILRYSLSHLLLPEQGNYLLDHDFCFPDRSGIVKKFRLELTFDPVWQQSPISLVRNNIAPGEGVVLRQKLSFSGEKKPTTYTKQAPLPQATPALPPPPAATWIRLLLLLFLVAWIATKIRGFFQWERSLNRFAPLPSTSLVDEQWLEKELFVHKAEVVGATWDKTTSTAEVAAVLSRMVQEGKMESWMKSYLIPFFNISIPGIPPVLYLKILQPRESFSGYEYKLVKGLFVDESTDTTDTKTIREYYRKKRKTFDPVLKIQEPLQRQMKKLVDERNSVLGMIWIPTVLLGVAGCFLLLGNAFLHQTEFVPLQVAAMVGLVFSWLLGFVFAYSYRHSVLSLKVRLAAIIFSLWFILIDFAVLLFFPASSLLLFGLFCLALSFSNNIINLSKSRESKEGLVLRRNFAAARNFFKQELAQKNPRIKDDWFPYLLAFGLGMDVDSWFRKFGGSVGHLSSTGIGSGSSTSGFTGGGGAFGGGGASGSWSMAVGSLTASGGGSSSGGSSGGGSSGGGGGGGW